MSSSRERWRRRVGSAAVALVVLYAGLVAIAWARVALDDDAPSTTHGDDRAGSITHGHPVPPWGRGYTTYSFVGSALGRQSVHRAVRDTWLAAAASAARGDRVYVLAETAWPSGGDFWPHRSHQRGLSIDVMTPLRDGSGGACSPPSWPWTALGYANELDDDGRLGDATIDAGDLARLLCALVREAPAHGARVRRVILAEEFRGRVARTAECALDPLWETRPVWVRHDEHFHVDFEAE